MTVARETTPTLSAATVAATETAIQTYQSIVARGGWNTVPAGSELRVGMKSKAVQALRQRLVTSGDLDANAGTGADFRFLRRSRGDAFSVAPRAWRRPASSTRRRCTNSTSPAETRLQQLQTNLVRLRAFSGDLGDRFVMVNIPAAAVETVENGVVVSHHVAGVGKIDRQSPIMQTKATEINFNPFWTVPPSLIKKDLIPKMQADPTYLTDEKIRVFNKAGEEVSPPSINWNTDEATHSNIARTPAPTSTRWARCASTSPTPTASTCTTRRRRAFSATTSASSRRAACACRTCATTSRGC